MIYQSPPEQLPTPSPSSSPSSSPSPQTTDVQLSKLTSILHDKNVYLCHEKTKHQKNKIKNMWNCYALYLSDNQLQINCVAATYQLYGRSQAIFRKQEREAFYMLINSCHGTNQSKCKPNSKPMPNISKRETTQRQLNRHQSLPPHSKVVCLNISVQIGKISFRLLNSCFSTLKFLKPPNNNSSSMESPCQNLETMRIFQFHDKPHLCLSPNPKLSQSSINCQTLDLSIVQPQSNSATTHDLIVTQHKMELLQQLHDLDEHLHQIIIKYQTAKQQLYSQMEISATNPTPRPSPSEESELYSREASLSNRHNENSNMVFSLASNSNIRDKQTAEETIELLMQRNQQLQQEVELMEQRISVLQALAYNDPNINPELLVILREVGDTLAPCPLGQSLMID